jgi:hypothetical protein
MGETRIKTICSSETVSKLLQYIEIESASTNCQPKESGSILLLSPTWVFGSDHWQTF